MRGFRHRVGDSPTTALTIEIRIIYKKVTNKHELRGSVRHLQIDMEIFGNKKPDWFAIWPASGRGTAKLHDIFLIYEEKE